MPLLFIASIMIIVGVMVPLVYQRTHNRMIDQYTRMAEGVTQLMVNVFDGDKVEEYIEKNYELPEYKEFSFRKDFSTYAKQCVAEKDREAFLRFIEPENIHEGLATDSMISLRSLTVTDGTEQYEMLRIAGVRTIEERKDHIVHAIGVGFSNVDRQTREEMENNRALAEALTRAEEANADKFTDPPGAVSFTVEQLDHTDEMRMLRFTMKDTGVGMDKEFIPKLFEPFSQEDSTTTNRYGGSGLGMAITKNMVSLMNGSIEVKSEKGCGRTLLRSPFEGRAASL